MFAPPRLLTFAWHPLQEREKAENQQRIEALDEESATLRAQVVWLIVCAHVGWLHTLTRTQASTKT